MPFRSSASPLDLVFTTFNGTVRALDPHSGQERWRFAPPSVRVNPALLRDQELLFLYGDGLIVALEVSTGTERWRVTPPLERVLSPRLELVEQVLLVGSGHELFAYAKLDGALLWQTRCASWVV